MPGLTLDLTLGMAALVLVPHLLSVTFARALRTYSRSRLEEYCEARGHDGRADAVAHLDEPTERAAEALAVLTGLALAALLGVLAARAAPGLAVGAVVAIALALGAVGYVAAGIAGRVYAEAVIDTAWPVAAPLRALMGPFTFVSRQLEAVLYRWARRSVATPRPPSVEVEIRSTDDMPADLEADLPEATRGMLERVVELGRLDISQLMTPRAAVVALPATVTALEAARTFGASGKSRIPLFGEHRDDIVGILYAKDLFPRLVEADDPDAVSPRKLARPPLFVPETKGALALLDELRAHRLQLAVVLDEYGLVAGLVALEDLIEHVVGPIDDEHDEPTSPDPVVAVGEARFEVDGLVELEELNERLGLSLPTDADFETVGGFAFNALGRLPEPGDSFRFDGAEFTVLNVADHSIRRLRVDLNPQPVGSP
ncbi:MAG TPA: hemolysin family protein [Isosphaeraceae bacterium]|jgi:CBS domain containing-hemolysin-like protein|nr:hemolysin family protein [Isosphaeraceae bacterium]